MPPPALSRIAPLLLAASLAACRDEAPAADPERLLADRPDLFAVEAPDGAPARGSAQALVTIVTFADLEAPRNRSNAQALAEIASRFPGEVRVVRRSNPLPRHRDAAAAERAIRAAGLQGRLWELHDALLAGGDIGEAGILRAAEASGVDAGQLLRDMDDPAVAEAVERDRRAALELGLDDAPWNFVNGRSLGPIRFVDDAVPLVREELQRARSLIAAGVPAGELHSRLTAGGKRRLGGQGRPAREVRDPEAIHRVPISPADPSVGPEDAPLTIVVFAGAACPGSARQAAALERLRALLGDRLRLVYKLSDDPGRPEATLAADRALAEAFGLRGTPWLFLNGRLRQGPLSFDQLLALAGPALTEALALPPGDDTPPYERLTAGGAEGPVWLGPGAHAPRSDGISDGTYEVRDVEPLPDTPFLGPADAPVTVVEFGDYQCGGCGRVHEALVALERRYRGRVRLAFLHFPVAGHEQARLAAEAAVEAAVQGRFWQYHELLLANRNDLSPGHLVELAREAGLDAAALETALADGRHRERVAADRRLGRTASVAGTPAIFVSGRRASSPRLEEELSLLVEHVLSLF